MIYKVNGIIEINYGCKNYCTIPYHGHPRGCPNFNVHENCPPKIGKLEDIFDTEKDMFFVTEEFDLKSHVSNMKSKHPEWTPIQLKNLLYWQGGVRKRLKNRTEEFISKTDSEMIYTLLPEAMGVMVINTALKLGIPIEKTPNNRVIKISLVGYKKHKDDKYEEVK